MNIGAGATRGILAAAGVFLGVVLALATARADDAAGSSDAARAAYNSAAALQNREAWDLAAEEWAELVKAHPRDPLAIKARYFLGVCQTKLGDWPAAAKTFREVAAAKSDPATVAQARFELGRGGFQAAQQKPSPAAYEEAAASLQEFLEKSPGQPQAADAVFFLGESLWQAGKREAALEAWQRFVREHATSPRMPEVLYALGVGQAELKRPAEAAATFKRFADTFPKHKLTDDVILWRAEVATAAGSAADAERLLAPLAAAKGPRSTEALERLGAARWAQKNWAGAAEAYAALAAQRSDVGEAARAAATAGRAYVEAGAIDKARPLLEKATAAPGDVGIDAAHSLAALELDAKQPARALEIANRALAAASVAKTPDAARLARLELDRADALWDLPGKKPEAAAAYAAIIKNRPQETSAVLAARAMTAVALLEEGKFSAALAAADSFLADKSAADAGQRLLDVRAIRAEALLGTGKAADAAVAYRELITQHPQAAASAAWQLREAAALASGKQWQKVHDALAPVTAKLTGDAAAEALLLDATALVELKKPTEAVKLLARIDQAHAAWPRRRESMLLSVRARREAGDTAGALKQAEELTKQFPTGPFADVAWYRLGQLRQETGRFDEAIEAFAKARSEKPQGPRAPWSVLAAGWCHDSKGRLREAIAAWTDLIDAYPDSSAASSALLARGDARYRSGDFKGGREDAERFLKAAPRSGEGGKPAAPGEARMLSALCLAGEKRHAEAAQAFRRLLDEEPTFAAADRALFEMGLAHALDGKKDDAVTTFRTLVEKFPKSPRAADAWLEIGEARYDAQAWDEAAKAYAAAAATAGSGPDAAALAEQARHKLGWSHAMRKDHAAAAAAFREQLAAAANGSLAADAQAMLGESLFQAGDYAAAAKPLAAALAKPEALSSDDLRGLAWLRAAECAARRDQWEESLKFATQLVKAQPAGGYSAQARYAAAWALQNLGQFDKALVAYREIADGGRSELAARARLMEGEVLFEQGNHKDAVKAFFKVAYGFGEQQAPAAFHPWQAQATFEAARCFEVLGKVDQAAKLYAEMVERYPDSQQAPAARKRLDALGGAAGVKKAS